MRMMQTSDSDAQNTYQVDGEQRTPLPFDLDLIFKHPQIMSLRRELKHARSPKGVYRLIHGSVQLDGSGNGIAVCTEQPGGGRIWFLRAAALFDAQNPQTIATAGKLSIYAEPNPPNFIAGAFQPNPPDPNGIIVPLGPTASPFLPYATTFSNWVYKLWNQDNLYAVLAGITGTSGQIGFICRVSEYNVEDVELMHT